VTADTFPFFRVRSDMLAPEAGATHGPGKMGKLLGPTRKDPDFPWCSLKRSGAAAKHAFQNGKQTS
jgi:hypothetical protein